LLDERDPKQRAALSKKYCRGWFLGSAKAKQSVTEDLAESNPGVDWEGVDLKELNAVKWEAIVISELKRLKKTDSDLEVSAKGVDWKVSIAKRLRKETTAKNPWIAKRLKMGHANYVSNLINK